MSHPTPGFYPTVSLRGPALQFGEGGSAGPMLKLLLSPMREIGSTRFMHGLKIDRPSIATPDQIVKP